MTTREDPRTRAPYADDLEAEQDVELGRYWRSLVQRWWLPAAGLVAGALIGFAVSSGGSRPYEASTIVYLGQPLYPGSPTPILPLTTSFKFVDQILHSRETVRAAAAAVGVSSQALG